MTASQPSSGGRSWVWIVVVVAAVVLTVLLTPKGETGEPYDLKSTEPDGYRGLDLLLDSTGTDVSMVDAGDISESSVDRFDTVFVPLGGRAEADVVGQWRRYVEAGGRLVLGSPSDHIGPAPVDIGFIAGGIGVEPGTCDVASMAGLDRVRIDGILGAVEVPSGASSCFGDGTEAVVVIEQFGTGSVTALASPDLFTNSTMGAPKPDKPVGEIPDNAVVAELLLGRSPDGGDTNRLAVVTSGVDAPLEPGTESLTDLMSPGVKLGLLELAAAFGFYLVYRGRRHGRVVTEPVPVSIAGSAFVEAVGSLLERQGDVGRAAEVLRDGQCRVLAERLGVPRSTPRRDLAHVLAARTGRDPAQVEHLLTGPVDDERSLVELTRELDSLRQEALHV